MDVFNRCHFYSRNGLSRQSNCLALYTNDKFLMVFVNEFGFEQRCYSKTHGIEALPCCLVGNYDFDRLKLSAAEGRCDMFIMCRAKRRRKQKNED